MPVESADVLVLGAGIAGCALAYHLARRGVSTAVYDPRTPAAGASGRAAGVVTEQLWDRWDVEVARETHRELAELCRRWDPAAYRQNGFVRWTADRSHAAALREAVERLRGWGVRVEEATGGDLERWLPAGRFQDVEAAIFSAGDGCVNPSAVTTIYAEGARTAGATFDFGRPMVGLARDGARWKADVGSGTLASRELVVAAGAWSKRILRSLGHPVPLTPYRTQAALLRPGVPAEPLLPTVHDLDTDVYVRPEDRGRLLGGDGTESVESDPERFAPGGDPAFLAHLAASLEQRFPTWAESEVVASWAGVCTATPDRHPVIGRVPGADGLYVLGGFNGFGVMRSGGAARRLADLIAPAGGTDAAVEALRVADPARFPNPELDFPPRPGFTLEGGDAPRF